MGNLLTTGVAATSPMISRFLITPALFHPYRFGGIPWFPPASIPFFLVYAMVISVMVWTMAAIAAMMTSKKACRKFSIMNAMKNAMWAVSFVWLALFLNYAMGFLKAPLILILQPLPYAGRIVEGIFIGLIVMIGGMIGNGASRKEVCGIKMGSEVKQNLDMLDKIADASDSFFD